LCGDEEPSNEFWAKVKFKSCQYLYDDGTCDQDYSWTLCRECKLILINFMTDAGAKRKMLAAYRKEKKLRRAS
jgi:hypothetical protein